MALAAGVDIGGTKVAVGIIDDHGAIRAQARFQHKEAPTPTAVVQRIAEAITFLVRDLGEPLKGVGIGAPGPMDLLHGILLDDPTLPQLYGVDIVYRVQQATGLEAWMENDADAALLGETFGREGADNLAMLTFGTGIGGAAIVQHHLLRGHRGLHPELGQLRLSTYPVPCEESLAGPALERLAADSGFDTARNLLQRAAEGSQQAAELLKPIREGMCQLLWNTLHAYAPETVVLGGGIMQEHFDLFEPDLLATTRAAYMVGGTHVHLRPARLGNDAGMVGAARMILEPQVVDGSRPRDPWPTVHMAGYPDYEAMSGAAAQQVVKLLQEKPDALLCAAAGASPQRTYELLAEEAKRHPRLFSQARVIKLDEWYGLPADSPSTCEAWLQRQLVSAWKLDPQRYVGFAINPPDPAAECRRIAAWLTENGPIDLAILGIGLSGRVGLNEPAEAMIAGPHLAQLAPESRQHGMLVGHTVDAGLTLGIGDLLRSRRIMLLGAGEGKQQVFKDFVTGRVTPHLPLSMLHLHPSALCCYDCRLG